jgi:glycogen debranching enzyme
MMDATTHDDPFAIPATVSMQERRPRTLKHGDTFAVLDHNGDLSVTADGADGLYHRDTRYLARLELLVEGARPMLLSSTLRDDNATLTCDLTNPDLRQLDGSMLDHDLIHVRRTKFVYECTCYERIAIRNYAEHDLSITLDIGFAADFVDLFEVRGMVRARHGEHHDPDVEHAAVTLSYTGLDSRLRCTRLRFDPEPQWLDGRQARYVVSLPAGGRTEFYVEASCDREPPPAPPLQSFFKSIRDARRAMRTSAARAASIATSNEIFNEAMRRSVADLTMLVTDTEQGPYPYAGIPWYSTVFGRDAIITALQTLWMDPAVARGVLGFLAANQATGHDAASDAEPGKILHELRQGEMAELHEVPFRRYYGSVDSTPLFVLLAGAYRERTGDAATLQTLWPNIEAALGWMDRDGDRDGDGLIEYFRQTDQGLANQGWKDSFDSIFHADGRLAEGPIALCEVQGYAYAARMGAAGAARALGRPERAAALEAQAGSLRERIETAFWSAEIGTYALALDGAKKPCLTRASNAGHLLLAGVPTAAQAAQVAAQLLGSALFSGWGVRTVAVDAARYNPMSYHNGSVWPHDNAMIGIGLARYGLRAEAARVLEALFDASVYIEHRRLPELVCGFQRRRNQGPTFYPVACAPQAWSATALISLLQSCLGITFDIPRRTVMFDRPFMPECLGEVILRQLAIGDARIDVMLRGAGHEVSMRVLTRTGEIRASLVS